MPDARAGGSAAIERDIAAGGDGNNSGLRVAELLLGPIADPASATAPPCNVSAPSTVRLTLVAASVRRRCACRPCRRHPCSR